MAVRFSLGTRCGYPSITYCDVQDGEGGVGGDQTNLTWGPNNIDPPADPFFEDPGNGNYRLKCPSAARNTANTGSAPQDEQDVDDDGDTSEKTPDHDLNFRVVNSVADMGSFESHSDCPLGDCASAGPQTGSFGPPDGVVDINDLVAVQFALGEPGGPCDVFPECSGDGFVDQSDFDLVRLHFGEQCGFPSGSGGSGGGWQDEPWAYVALNAFGLTDWQECEDWVPEADLGELAAFLDVLMVLLTLEE